MGIPRMEESCGGTPESTLAPFKGLVPPVRLAALDRPAET